MKFLYLGLILSVIAIIGIIPISAQESNTIPSWIKVVAGAWSENKLTDTEYSDAMKFLIEQDIIKVSIPINESLTNELNKSEKNLEDMTEYAQSLQHALNNNDSDYYNSEIVDNGDFVLTMNPTLEYQYEYDLLESVLNEEIIDLNKLLKLPYDVKVITDECGESNAFFEPYTNTIRICYELVNDFLYVFSDDELFTDTSKEQVESDVIYNIVETLYHEVGHAMLYVWGIPFTGLEENVADQFAVFIIWFQFDDQSVSDILYGVGNYYWSQGLIYEQDQSDVHSLDLQRFHNLSCYAYGFDPVYNSDLVLDEWLPESRAQTCTYEFESLTYGFSNIFMDYMKIDY